MHRNLNALINDDDTNFEIEMELRTKLNESVTRIANLEQEKDNLIKSNKQLKGMLQKNVDIEEKIKNKLTSIKSSMKSVDMQTDNNE